MKVIFILFGAIVLLTACGRRGNPQSLSGDEKLRQQLIGTWYGKNEGIFEFDPDGHSTSSFTNGTRSWLYHMTWTVQNSNFIDATVTQVSAKNTTNYEAVGHTTRFEVVQIDEHHLVYVFDMESIEGRRLTNWVSR